MAGMRISTEAPAGAFLHTDAVSAAEVSQGSMPAAMGEILRVRAPGTPSHGPWARISSTSTSHKEIRMRILFDTLAYYSTLRKSGVPEDEALAMTRALEVALSQGVARREDLEALARRIETAFSALVRELTAGAVPTLPRIAARP